VTTLAAAQEGVVTRAQLAAAGVPATTVSRWVEQGRLTRHRRGVFVVSASPATPMRPLWMAVLSTGGVLRARSAAFVWQLLDTPPARIEIYCQAQARPYRGDDVALVRHTLLPGEQTRRWGIPVTTRPCTVLDTVATLPFAASVAFLDRALRQGWVSEDDLDRRLTTPRRGNPAVRRAARICRAGLESEAERVARALFTSAGLPGWIRQYQVMSNGRLVARVDFGFPQHRLVVEIDGYAYHHDRHRFQRDRQRQNDLAALGWVVLRFTWFDLHERPGELVARIRRHILTHP
jgi:very-short-patch-repair endonuclease